MLPGPAVVPALSKTLLVTAASLDFWFHLLGQIFNTVWSIITCHIKREIKPEREILGWLHCLRGSATGSAWRRTLLDHNC